MIKLNKGRNNEIVKQNKVLDLFYGVAITVCLTFLFGCATNNSEDYSFDDHRIEMGFSVTNSDEILPWLATATKTNEKQSKKTTFDVCAGYKRGFADRANQGTFNFNPNDGLFVLRLIVRDNNDKDVLHYDDELTSFLDEDQYRFEITNSRRLFKYDTSVEIDFNSVPSQKGYVLFDICLVDQFSEKIYVTLDCGISLAFLYFSQFNDCVRFSSSPF